MTKDAPILRSWVVKPPVPAARAPSASMYRRLEDPGRVRLSKSFYMRDFLYSEIAYAEGISNVPDNADLAIAAGRQLCERVLEPLQDGMGRLTIRSPYRSAAVNAKGAENGIQYNCASNERNCAAHIWDRIDEWGGWVRRHASWYRHSSALRKTGDWTALAR